MSEEGNGHLICVPGQRICEVNDTHIGGEGTYTFNDYIYASLAGKVSLTKQENITIIKV